MPVKNHRQTASLEADDGLRQQIARDPGHNVLDDRPVPFVDFPPLFLRVVVIGKINRALELARDQAGAGIGQPAAGRQDDVEIAVLETADDLGQRGSFTRTAARSCTAIRTARNIGART